MPSPSLSDLPLEILDIILSKLHHNVYYYPAKHFYALRQVLLLNKRFCSVAAKHLYQDVDPSSLGFVEAEQLLSILLCSTKNKTCLPYYAYIEELSIKRWCQMLSLDYRSQGSSVLCDLKIILCAILQQGQLRDLEVDFPQHFRLLATLPDFEVTKLKNFRVTFHGDANRKDSKSLSRIKTLTSQMRLGSLDVNMRCPTALDCLEFQKDSLCAISVKNTCSAFSQGSGVILSGFTHTLLASQSQTLTSLSLTYLSVIMPSSISLSNLQRLKMDGCQVAGWENVCKSFNALTHLDLESVYFSSKPDLVNPADLQVLRIDRSPCPGTDILICLLEEHSKSFRNLRVLDVTGFMSVDIVADILLNSRGLLEFTYYYSRVRDDPRIRPNDEYLGVISRLAPANLELLTVTRGSYSSQALSSLISALPASIISLNLSGSRGLTPVHLRALLELPLRELSLDRVGVELEYLEEIRRIGNMEKPPGLKYSGCFVENGWEL